VVVSFFFPPLDLFIFVAVAFSARTSNGYAHMLNIGQNAAIRFTNVVTNLGNGYDSLHGIFTAPRSGVSIVSALDNTMYKEYRYFLLVVSI
jgi:hypothetical protein